MDKTRRYLESDYTMICMWLFKRGLPVIPKDMLPLVGFLVDDVACGFLYKTDSSVGILDMYMSNPDADKVRRSMAFDNISTLLISHAKGSKIRVLKCNTEIDRMKTLILHSGFKYIGEFASFARET